MDRAPRTRPAPTNRLRESEGGSAASSETRRRLAALLMAQVALSRRAGHNQVKRPIRGPTLAVERLDIDHRVVALVGFPGDLARMTVGDERHVAGGDVQTELHLVLAGRNVAHVYNPRAEQEPALTSHPSAE